jgi:hypothetical protein
LNGHIEHIAISNGSIFGPNIFSKRQQSSSHAQANRWIGDDYIIHPASFNDSAIGDTRIALPVTSTLHFQDEPNFTGTFHPFHGDLGLGLGWEPSQHVSGPTFMTGGISLPTNGFQFANASDLGHLLSFPMQTHETAFMQGLPDGSNAWDSAGLTNASPHNGQVFAAFSMPDSLYVLAMLPCRHLARNKTFKRGGQVSPRAKHSSQESKTILLSLLSAARAAELDTVDQTR